MKRRYTRSQRQQLKKFRTLGVLIFAAVMAIGAFIGHKSFAFFIIIKAFINDCSCLTGNLRCIVFTVICNYKNII